MAKKKLAPWWERVCENCGGMDIVNEPCDAHFLDEEPIRVKARPRPRPVPPPTAVAPPQTNTYRWKGT
jgi:hypothetical protein